MEACSLDGPFAARTTRKIRSRLLPFLLLLYVISYLDRINIGFAALTMNKDLAISGQQFGFAAGIFFLGYLLFEIPSNLLLHKIGARIWIARILISWGILATLTGFVHGIHQLYVVRFLLGVAEAGYLPGMVLYLTYWFGRRDQARAFALFLMGLPVASILGAPLSGYLLDHVHWLGVASWRWLFLLEGAPAFLGGVLAYFLLPNGPREAKFLSADEKSWLQEALAREENEKGPRPQPTTLEALTNPRVWYLGGVQFGALIGLYTLSFWVPQLLKSLSGKFSNTTVGMLVMIPHLAGLLAMILVGRSSDRTAERRYHAAVPLALAAAALFLAAPNRSPFELLALLCLVAGLYSYFGPFWAIPAEFLSGVSAAAGIALINSIGSLAGFLAPYLIGLLGQKTGNLYRGFALAAIPLMLSALLLVLLPKLPGTPRR